MEMNPIQYFTISIIPVLLAITVHEAAHGYAAKHFGDKTAFFFREDYIKSLKAYRSNWNHFNPWGIIVIECTIFIWLGETCSSKFFKFKKP